ncbi:MAG: DUF3850 domain-containing protein [Bacteroides sp.]|nr:DUF3850 domain-containing protein [Eubacterium sp.]MCM1418150.1 DUF3850 domain-containing protein [Roseburia sp.]MCM1462325.1 DUF3850 domain-containing protein [Bacteroides sp.]
MIHELKIFPGYFNDLVSGEKTFEVRENDRDYKVGDYLALNECAEEVDGDAREPRLTGQSILCRITYVLKDQPYCKEGYAILGIYPCKVIMADWAQSPSCLLT